MIIIYNSGWNHHTTSIGKPNLNEQTLIWYDRWLSQSTINISVLLISAHGYNIYVICVSAADGEEFVSVLTELLFELHVAATPDKLSKVQPHTDKHTDTHMLFTNTNQTVCPAGTNKSSWLGARSGAIPGSCQECNRGIKGRVLHPLPRSRKGRTKRRRKGRRRKKRYK